MVACSSDHIPSRTEPAERASALSWLMLVCLSFALLGQGQRCDVDPRFGSPLATIQTYWEALREGDAETASLCIDEGSYTGPYPGSVWFMPPSHDLRVEAAQTLPVRPGRVLVNYEVHYFALGASEEFSFRTGSHLVRARGEWRIVPPFGDVSSQDFRPIHRLAPI